MTCDDPGVMSSRHSFLLASVTRSVLCGACSGGSPGSDALADREACSNSGGMDSPCGGTVSAAGSTPFGAFEPDAITAMWVDQCDSQQELIELQMGDTRSGDRLHIRGRG